MKKYVYLFSEGNKDMRNLLGGKGANLAEMTNIGLPVPQGFTVTTEACTRYYEDGKVIAKEIEDQVYEKLAELEKITGKTMGDAHNPLLVSVRSGARASMPGMMDTVLNLGMNDEVAKGFTEATQNPRFVYDSYRRFIQMFADVVMGFPKSSFEHMFDKVKEEKGVEFDTDLTADDLKEVVEIYKEEYKKHAGVDFPQDPKVQMMEAIKAVFRSWNNDRAITYRRLNDIPGSWGTAVNVQEMVYGNRGETSGTGVAFTRNPATGEKKLYGEYLMNAQGEDVVAGIRTPQTIDTLKEVMPDCYDQFVKINKILEDHYKDMQDMEFTIEDGKLFMLQTRNGKRTAAAALKIAVDLVNESMITKEEALLKVEPKQLDQLLHPNFDDVSLRCAQVVATGLAASPGAATGRIYFTAEDVIEASKNGVQDILLVRLETSPEDIEGMNIAHGILTIRGGMTSHAAVVARGMGTCCVCGCGSLKIDEENKILTTPDGKQYHEGDYMSLDGSTGNVYGEQIKTVEPEISGDFETFMEWADEVRKLQVRTNADTPRDALQARKFGAEGIGLCRTEHMFFEEERIFNFRRMITAETEEARREALEKILPYQRSDFKELFKAMEIYPVTIRFLDPPLHEFLPHTDEEIRPLAESLGMTFDALKARVESLKEFNPMMGHRGCRLAVTYPEIAEMQTRAVIEAAIAVNREGQNVVPEIMIPLVGDVHELKYVKKVVCDTADKIIKEAGVELPYKVGTMIEIPRAALTADKIAEEAEFFSFGTNDLTQMTYGFSRDDAAKFLGDYYGKQIFESDPFAKVDQEGVGELMRIAIEKGKKTRPDIKLGICGEHGGEASTVEFCHKLGLTYVSCSPFRVPLARLAAAQAAVKEKMGIE
ncbi:pyruvate, phosphate dikinase [Massilimicrobiota sp. An134]|uniref:pyruvate, phosphate dikinase n=1 Tax=Massilimicrobiota sp. An134 TaxID=1965557 RepID=UPI000B37D770|nr:pyruvate, phosphate dikinase [Massilimicrobiota sp. An134]OUQ31225.1 pyruvate, phosphate dikinase [Massilimicrobiota sp. An134]